MAIAEHHDAFKREDDRLQMIDHQFNTRCEDETVSMAVFKDIFIFYSWTTDHTEEQSQELYIRIAKLQKKLHSQLQQVFYA